MRGWEVKQEFKDSLQVTVVCMLHGWSTSRKGRGEVRTGMQRLGSAINVSAINAQFSVFEQRFNTYIKVPEIFIIILQNRCQYI